MPNVMQHRAHHGAPRYVEAPPASCQGGEKAQVQKGEIPLDDWLNDRKPSREYDHDDETGLDMDDDCAVEDPLFDPEDDAVEPEERF
jgi:hypothetical protein